jgi:hypothetical protein
MELLMDVDLDEIVAALREQAEESYTLSQEPGRDRQAGVHTYNGYMNAADFLMREFGPSCPICDHPGVANSDCCPEARNPHHV